MSDQPQPFSNDDQEMDTRLREVAESFQYPPTPDIAGKIRARLPGQKRAASMRHLLVRAAIVVVLLFAGLLFVPEIRAGIIEIIRLGAIRILVNQPTPTVIPNIPTLAINKIAGETTLQTAQRLANFTIKLPSTLPKPDRVYFQRFGGPFIILVWFEPGSTDKVRYSLHELGPGAIVNKTQPEVIEKTTVNGQPALWTEGAHFIEYVGARGNEFGEWNLVAGNVLIWTDGSVTYRFESQLPMAEAVKIAESLA
jgi:hypothetical protein